MNKKAGKVVDALTGTVAGTGAGSGAGTGDGTGAGTGAGTDVETGAGSDTLVLLVPLVADNSVVVDGVVALLIVDPLFVNVVEIALEVIAGEVLFWFAEFAEMKEKAGPVADELTGAGTGVVTGAGTDVSLVPLVSLVVEGGVVGAIVGPL